MLVNLLRRRRQQLGTAPTTATSSATTQQGLSSNRQWWRSWCCHTKQEEMELLANEEKRRYCYWWRWWRWLRRDRGRWWSHELLMVMTRATTTAKQLYQTPWSSKPQQSTTDGDEKDFLVRLVGAVGPIKEAENGDSDSREGQGWCCSSDQREAEKWIWWLMVAREVLRNKEGGDGFGWGGSRMRRRWWSEGLEEEGEAHAEEEGIGSSWISCPTLL